MPRCFLLFQNNYPIHYHQVIHEPLRTGFEVDKDFVPERDVIVAGRFQVRDERNERDSANG